jgi:hypothetical protein
MTPSRDLGGPTWSAIPERAEEATYAEIGRLRQELIEPRLAQAARAKLLNVLVHTELFEPVRNLLHRSRGLSSLSFNIAASRCDKLRR